MGILECACEMAFALGTPLPKVLVSLDAWVV